MNEDLESRLLAELARRASSRDRLANTPGIPADELEGALANLKRQGWLNEGLAWYGNDPDATGLTILLLTRAGREEAKRRRILTDETEEPHVITRTELVDELKRRFNWTDERIAMSPSLRGERFWYWPSLGAFSIHAEPLG